MRFEAQEPPDTVNKRLQIKELQPRSTANGTGPLAANLDA